MFRKVWKAIRGFLFERRLLKERLFEKGALRLRNPGSKSSETEIKLSLVQDEFPLIARMMMEKIDIKLLSFPGATPRVLAVSEDTEQIADIVAGGLELPRLFLEREHTEQFTRISGLRGGHQISQESCFDKRQIVRRLRNQDDHGIHS